MREGGRNSIAFRMEWGSQEFMGGKCRECFVAHNHHRDVSSAADTIHVPSLPSAEKSELSLPMCTVERLEEGPDLNNECPAETSAWSTQLGFVSLSKVLPVPAVLWDV